MIFLLIVIGGLQAQAQSPVQQLDLLMQSWRTLELETRIDQENQLSPLGGEANPGLKQRLKYVESGPDRRFYEETMEFEPGPRIVNRYFQQGQAYARSAQQVSSEKSVEQATRVPGFVFESTSGRRACPLPLAAWYAGLQRLPEVLKQSVPVRQVTLLDQPCDVYEVERPTSSIHLASYALNVNTGVPLEVREYASPADVARDQPVFVWKAFDTGQNNPLHLPTNSELTQFGGQDGSQAIVRQQIHLENVVLEPEILDSLFRPAQIPEPTPGVDPSPSRKAMPTSEKNGNAAFPGSKLETLDPVAGQKSPLPGILLLIGTGLLMVAGGLAWKRSLG